MVADWPAQIRRWPDVQIKRSIMKERSLIVIKSGEVPILCAVLNSITDWCEKRQLNAFVRNVADGYEIFATTVEARATEEQAHPNVESPQPNVGSPLPLVELLRSLRSSPSRKG
jgi:hypothetical protein